MADDETWVLEAKIDALRRELKQIDEKTYAFVALLAHELRSPLGAILMWAHVLRMGKEEDRGPAIEAIETSARTQSKMIGNLLEVCRAEAGRLRIERSSVSLREVVHAVVEAQQAAAEARSVRLDVSIDEDELRVRADPVRLREVVSILIASGVRLTPGGGVVHVHLERAGGSARFVVEDQGRGLSPTELADLFNVFRSVGDIEGRAIGGLGLELPLARHLAELHDGSITATSEGAGRGSTLCLQIPLETTG